MSRRKKSVGTWRIHPGEILREEFLKPMKMSAYKLSNLIGVPVPRINDIVLEKRGISADTAVRLAKFFGTSEQFWMNLQAAYEVRLAKARLQRDLRRIQPRRARRAA
ncbi:MAG: HigA family addiction module antidote protein [Acidobacteria bacterium]|nr:HigA family addiction module antidote protein [Acidobacteriota bacterium]